ncbi:MAG: glutamine--fructose-6-phosphate transaminase (isomerizing) [Dongiaceae bacterium]
MCGIIGYIGPKNAAPILMDGLKRLEYRGYDSAGLANLVNGKIERRRAEGKLINLEQKLNQEPLAGNIGIGHTRWATHGVPNETNAHPHATENVAVAHNGIIENFQELREELEKAGHKFSTETDTEVIVHLLDYYLKQKLSPEQAVGKMLGRLHGAFALAIIFAGHENLFAARRGSPLVIGHGNGEMFIGSDAIALGPLTQKLAYLEEGDWAMLDAKGVKIFDAANKPVKRPVTDSPVATTMMGKGGFRHYMLKEIYEQATVLGDVLHAHLNPNTRQIHIPEFPFHLKNIKRLYMIACGTSYHAAMVARYWLEEIAKVPVEVDIASEFRYRRAVLDKDGLGIFISQSGETADTLAALRHVKESGLSTLAIVNVATSTMAREATAKLLTLAGPEIGVASTKAFTTQLMALACFTLALARARGILNAQEESKLAGLLTEIPELVTTILQLDSTVEKIARDIYEARDVLYMGRNTLYPIALEGALKLKEISYIHAEGYAAGELKHGPIALIDEEVPIISLLPTQLLHDKMASNIQEVVARGGRVIAIGDQEALDKAKLKNITPLILPKVDAFIAPVLYTIPVQLLAYHIAVLKGTDVDQPRNLAKSVTVE